MSTETQRSFASGEISPSLYARVDTEKYGTGARTMRNTYVMRNGGTVNRPGTRYVGEPRNGVGFFNAVKLVDFIFSSTVAYVLEFGAGYMRPIKNGDYFYYTPVNITAITQTVPTSVPVITATAHGLSVGDVVYFDGIVGPSELNGRFFTVWTVVDANNFGIAWGSTTINVMVMPAYVSGGTASKVYQIITQYAAGDMQQAVWAQSADVMTITVPGKRVAEISRSGDMAWTWAYASFGPNAGGNGLNPSGYTAGSNTYQYVITTIDNSTGAESLALTNGGITSVNISSVSGASANVLVTTSAVHNLSNGDMILVGGSNCAQINGRTFTVSVSSTTQFLLNSVDGTSFTAAGAGGTIQTCTLTAASAATPTVSAPITLNTSINIRVYRATNGVYGYIGTALSGKFLDIGYTPDLLTQPPAYRGVFQVAGDYPTAVGYAQQRQLFGNTPNNPSRWLGSRVGSYKNFMKYSPIGDGDSFDFTLAGTQVKEINHFVDVGSLFILTSSVEFLVQSSTGGAVTPTNVVARPVSYYGAAKIRPLIVDAGILFVQARGTAVRELRYNQAFGQVVPLNLTDFAQHLLKGRTIIDWAYQQIPHSVVWIVCSDGQMLGITYNKDQNILAWHRHDTGGPDDIVESVAVVPEGGEDAVYISVLRNVLGRSAQTRMVERFSSRNFSDPIDGCFSDLATTYDGRNTNPTGRATITQISGGGFTTSSHVQVQLSGSGSFPSFNSAYIGREFQFLDDNGARYRILIDTIVNSLCVQGYPVGYDIPTQFQNVAFTSWSIGITQLTSLGYMEGMKVSIAGDNNVIASPNNSAYPVMTVTHGNLTLPIACSVIHVGLPYISDLETLDIDSAQGETLADKKKTLSKVLVHTEGTRGLWVGGENPDTALQNTTGDPLYGMVEMKAREFEGYNQPTNVQTGKMDIVIQSHWDSNGRVFLRQVDPVPVSILAVSPAGFILGGL